MRYSIQFIAMAATSLVALTGFAQESMPSLTVLNHVKFRSLEQPDQSFTWKDGIGRDTISLKSHIIARSDTYASIIERYGIRADPNSIEIFRRLNNDRYPVRKLPPNKKLIVVVNRLTQQLAVSVHSDIKTKIDTHEKALRDQRGAISAWARRHPDSSRVGETQLLYDTIVQAIQQFKITGYALERPVLQSTDEALREARNIVRDLVTKNRAPTKRELTFLEKVMMFLGIQNTAARDTAGRKIEANIVTITGRTAAERCGLSLCFKYALALDTFRQQHPHREPHWSCDEAFDTLSSPAKRLFTRSFMYVIWAVDGGERVSDHRIITIEPNVNDSTFRHELHVTEG